MPRNIAIWPGAIEVHTAALFTFTQTVRDTRKKLFLNFSFGFLVSYGNVLMFAWYFLVLPNKVKKKKKKKKKTNTDLGKKLKFNDCQNNFFFKSIQWSYESIVHSQLWLG